MVQDPAHGASRTAWLQRERLRRRVNSLGIFADEALLGLKNANARLCAGTARFPTVPKRALNSLFLLSNDYQLLQSEPVCVSDFRPTLETRIDPFAIIKLACGRFYPGTIRNPVVLFGR